MTRPARLLACLLLATGAGALALGAFAEEKETLPVLRRKLLEASGEAYVGRALDRLTAKIGQRDFFADHGAFGDWLGTLPDGRAEHPLVCQRRGWAYVLAKRGSDALLQLRTALKDDPSSGLTRAYLGEALRQAGEPMDAVRMLATAAKCGAEGQHLEESVRESIFGVQRAEPAARADGVPAYVTAIRIWLEVRPDPLWHHTAANLLLEDRKRHAKPGTERAKLWAEVAADHAMAALTTATAPIADADRLAYDAAVALESLDRERDGHTARFDLLGWAYRLGRLPGDAGHRFPQVLTWMAEAAAAEHRFELAFRLAHERLALSNSPQARRLLMRLPPDLEPGE